jgi:sporulation protein YlmC with PRC-barrel domain
VTETLQFSYADAIAGKDVITCSEGAKLGRANSIVVDAATLTLEALTLTATPQPETSTGVCVPLAELTQIGDVVLVESASALQPTPSLRGFVQLLNFNVKDTAGAQSPMNMVACFFVGTFVL